MESDIVEFYSLFFIIVFSALCMVFSSRMQVLLFSFFSLICSTSFLYWNLGSRYIAIFQFILFGIILLGYIFYLLKKIGCLDLKSKLKNKPFLICASFIVLLFFLLAIAFFSVQYDNSLYSVFNIVQLNESESISFKNNFFLFQLTFVLFVIVAFVARVLLMAYFRDSRSDNGEE